MRRHWQLLAPLLLLLFGLWYHWPAGADFKSDDYPAIAYAQDFERVLHDFVGRQYDLRFLVLYRPLITLSLWCDQQLFGTQAFGYLLMNVLAFLASVCLLYAIVRSLVPGRAGHVAGIVLGLLWILHPVVPVSLRWVVGRVDTHVVFWMLLAAFLHLRARRGGARWPVWLAASCALLTKESAFGLPLLLLGLDLCDPRPAARGPRLLGARLQSLPLLALLPIALLLRRLLLGTFVGGYSFQAQAGFDPFGSAEGLLHTLVVALTGRFGNHVVAQVLAVSLLLAALFLHGRRAPRLGLLLAAAVVLVAAFFGPLAQPLPSMRGSLWPRHAYFAVLLPLGVVVTAFARTRAPLGWALLAALVWPLWASRGPVLAELEQHDIANRRVLAACRDAAALVPAPLPIALAGEAELVNHPQRFLWGLGAALQPPFDARAREIVTLRKLQKDATPVPVDALALPAWVEVHAAPAPLAAHVQRGGGPSPVPVAPSGFDGTLHVAQLADVAEPSSRIGWPAGPGWDGLVHVVTSVGSFTLQTGLAGQPLLPLRHVLLGDVTWTDPQQYLVAVDLLWNAADLSRNSPIYLFWREQDRVCTATLTLDDDLLEELYESHRRR